LQKKQYQNRVGVLEKLCSGTFGSWLHAFLGKTGASHKVKSYVTLPFRKIRNCKGLEASPPGFDIATSKFILFRVTIDSYDCQLNQLRFLKKSRNPQALSGPDRGRDRQAHLNTPTLLWRTIAKLNQGNEG